MYEQTVQVTDCFVVFGTFSGGKGSSKSGQGKGDKCKFDLIYQLFVC